MKICMQCSNEITKPRREKYCSKKCCDEFCDARKKNERPEVSCLYCKEKTKNEKFCSNSCQLSFKRLKAINSGIFSASVGRVYLIKTYGIQCEMCKLTEWQGKIIPIELDHRDGNSENNSLSNLRLLCPNCHAQTPTYKSKNRGNGRHFRVERRKAGKSY